MLGNVEVDEEHEHWDYMAQTDDDDDHSNAECHHDTIHSQCQVGSGSEEKESQIETPDTNQDILIVILTSTPLGSSCRLDIHLVLMKKLT